MGEAGSMGEVSERPLACVGLASLRMSTAKVPRAALGPAAAATPVPVTVAVLPVTEFWLSRVVSLAMSEVNFAWMPERVAFFWVALASCTSSLMSTLWRACVSWAITASVSKLEKKPPILTGFPIR